MGRNTCNSRPVDARGCQFEAPTTFNSCEKLNFCVPKHWPLIGSTDGHPKGSWLSPANWPELIRNCDFLTIGSNPKSKNGAIATGPAIVILYSAFETRLRSPPGNVIWSTGTRTVYGGLSGLLGSRGTIELSGLRREMVEAVGRKATGETE